MPIWTMSGGGKSTPTGLSPGQTAGEVAGEYIVRPAGSPETQAYVPGVGSTSIMIEGGATAGRGGLGVRGTTTIRRDRYGNVIGVRQTDASGNIIFERKPTPGGGLVEEGLPASTQSRYVEIQREREMMPLYRRRAEYSQKQQAIDRQQQAEIIRTPSFQLPILTSTQNRYKSQPKRYYTVSYPSGFGHENVAHEYRPGEKFKILGLIPYKEPKPGKFYTSDILGFTREKGEIEEEEIRSSMERGALKRVSTTDIKLRQLGNLLAVSPFIIKYPYLKPSVSIKPKGKPPLEKMFGSKTFVSQKKVFGGQRYFVEPKPAAQPIRTPILNKMFGGTAKPSPKVDVLRNMFGTSSYQKPRKTTIMDILLVQPQRQRQISKPIEWRQVISKPSELKPRTDYESIYQQQAVRNILQYTKISKVAKPTPQVTVAKPIKTYGVMEYLRSKQQYRYSPQAFKPALRTTTKPQYIFAAGWAGALGSLSGLMQGQRQEQRLGQLFGQQQAQAQKQGFKQRYIYDFKFKYPPFPKIGVPETIFTSRPTQKPPVQHPPKTPPPPIKQPPIELPFFRPPPKPIILRMPSFEVPTVLGQRVRRKQAIKSKIVRTRMLSLADLFGR